MNVPKYIRDLLARSEWAIEAHPCRLPKGCDPGYTIILHKRTAYSLAHTLEKETRTLKNWCDRQMKTRDQEYDPTTHSIATIHHCPTTTHYNDQWAVITIYDPIMKNIEGFIGQ